MTATVKMKKPQAFKGVPRFKKRRVVYFHIKFEIYFNLTPRFFDFNSSDRSKILDNKIWKYFLILSNEISISDCQTETAIIGANINKTAKSIYLKYKDIAKNKAELKIKTV